MITEELLPALQAVFPSQIVTVDENNMSNTTFISQVYRVDEEHVAISNQFFSKTFQNLHKNKKACVQVINPNDFIYSVLNIELVRIETEGELFDYMCMQLELIASMSGMEDVFVLQSAYIFKVLDITHYPQALS